MEMCKTHAHCHSALILSNKTSSFQLLTEKYTVKHCHRKVIVYVKVYLYYFCDLFYNDLYFTGFVLICQECY